MVWSVKGDMSLLNMDKKFLESHNETELKKSKFDANSFQPKRAKTKTAIGAFTFTEAILCALALDKFFKNAPAQSNGKHKSRNKDEQEILSAARELLISSLNAANSPAEHAECMQRQIDALIFAINRAAISSLRHSLSNAETGYQG